MTWARIDDRFWTNRKVRQAWDEYPAAVGLHAMALSYCADQLSDGFVHDAFIRGVIPHPKQRAKALKTLFTSGLWHEANGGHVIHDWLDYNASKEQILQQRRADRDRKAQGRPTRVRPDSGRRPGGVQQSHPIPSFKEEEKEEEKTGSPAGHLPPWGTLPLDQRTDLEPAWYELEQQALEEDEPT